MMKEMSVLVSVFLLAGCASISQQINRSGPLTDEQIANARADDVPLIIYDTSFSHSAASQPAAELTVRFINVSDKQIDSVTLLVVSCLGGQQDIYATLPMKGPFTSKAIYASHPVIEGPAGWSIRETSRMSIKAADVVFQDGSKQSFTDNVSKLLDGRLSNFCTAASDPH